MDDLSAQHLAHLESQRVKAPNTLAARRRVLASVDIAGTATCEQIETWWDARADLAPATRAADLSHLRSFYRWCARWDHRADDPTRRIDPPKVANAVHKKISNEDISEVARHMPPDLRRALLLGTFAGLRISESAALDWADVDSAEDVILVRLSKGVKSRVVPVSPDLIRRLGDDGVIGNVVTAGGPPVAPSALQRRMNRAIKRAGGEFTTHDLRHRWGMTAYRSCQDLLAVAEMMGHSNINTTRVYASADSEVKRKIAAAVMF